MLRLVPLLLVALAAAVGCDARRTHPAVGRTVESLPVASVSDPAAPPPDLAGRVTLLNFWGTWCPPCRRELPGLVRLARRLADEPRFQLVAVSCAGVGGDDPETLSAETRRFLVAQRLDLAAWRFADPVPAAVLSAALGLDALPATFLVGPDARIRQAWIGYRSSDEPEIAAAVVAALRESAR